MSSHTFDQDSSTGKDQAADASESPDLIAKVLAAFESAPVPLRARVCSILGINSNEVQDQESASKPKRKHSPEADEEPAAKKGRMTIEPPTPMPINFGDLRNPDKAIDCLVQVNLAEPAGSLRSRQNDYGIKLYLDGGRSGPPNLGLQFKYPGSSGIDCSRVNWHMDSRVRGQWVIKRFEYVYVKRTPNDTDVNHRRATTQCGIELLGRLMCVTVDVTRFAGEALGRQIPPGASSASRTCLGAIFTGTKDYTLRIWFIQPTPDIDSRCLRFIQCLYEQRRAPLSHAQDAAGICFADLLRSATAVPSRPAHLQEKPEKMKGWSKDTEKPLDADDRMSPAGTRGAKATTTGKQKPEDVKMPFHAGFRAQSASASMAQSSIASDEAGLGQSRNVHANKPVPSFNFSFPTVSVKAHTQSTKSKLAKDVGTSASSRAQLGPREGCAVETETSGVSTGAPFAHPAAAMPSLADQEMLDEDGEIKDMSAEGEDGIQDDAYLGQFDLCIPSEAPHLRQAAEDDETQKEGKQEVDQYAGIGGEEDDYFRQDDIDIQYEAICDKEAEEDKEQDSDG